MISIGDGILGFAFNVTGGTKGLQVELVISNFGLAEKFQYSTTNLTSFGNLTVLLGAGAVVGSVEAVNGVGAGSAATVFTGVGYSTTDGWMRWKWGSWVKGEEI